MSNLKEYYNKKKAEQLAAEKEKEKEIAEENRQMFMSSSIHIVPIANFFIEQLNKKIEVMIATDSDRCSYETTLDNLNRNFYHFTVQEFKHTFESIIRDSRLIEEKVEELLTAQHGIPCAINVIASRESTPTANHKVYAEFQLDINK